MTIIFGGITLSDDMYLSGFESANLASVEQLRTIEGVSVVRTKPTPGGTPLTLGSQNKSGAVQGIWCSEDIDQVKGLELAAQSVELNYRDTIYNVVIAGTEFTPFHQWEPEGPYKKFTGSISLIEV